MTSIEWLIEEMISKGFFKETVTLTDIDHLQYKAEEMYNKEVEISDEEIEKAARDYDNSVIYGPPLLHFEQGAFWYREQLKSKSTSWQQNNISKPIDWQMKEIIIVIIIWETVKWLVRKVFDKIVNND